MLTYDSIEKIKNNLEKYTGMPGDTVSQPTYFSAHYITQGVNLTTAISQLDSSIMASHRIVVPPDGESIPSLVKNNIACDTVQTSNSASTKILNFKDGYIPMIIRVIFGDSNTTVASGENIVLAGNQDFIGNVDDVLTLVRKSDGIWLECGRSLNQK